MGMWIDANSTKVVRYTPPTSGSYTFETTGDYDTYLYVIDPRSHEKLVANEDYNDDGGEGTNALLTIDLDANVPYLVIISPYNPGTVDDHISGRFFINIHE